MGVPKNFAVKTTMTGHGGGPFVYRADTYQEAAEGVVDWLCRGAGLTAKNADGLLVVVVNVPDPDGGRGFPETELKVFSVVRGVWPPKLHANP